MRKIFATVAAAIAIFIFQLAASGNRVSPDGPAGIDSVATLAARYEQLGAQAENDADFEQAHSLYNKSHEAYRAAGDEASASGALLKRSEMEERMFRMEASAASMLEAEAAARLSGDDRALFYALARQKKLARQLNRYSDYLRASTSLDSLSNSAIGTELRGEVVLDMAETAEEAGEIGRAVDIYNSLLQWQDSLPQSKSRDVLITAVLDKLAYLNLEKGDFDGALAAATRNAGMKKSGDTKSPLGLALTYHRLSSIYAQMQDTLKAVSYADSILAVAAAAELPFYRAYMHLLGGVSFKQTDSLERAVDCYTRALEYPGLEISAHGLLGNVYHRLGSGEKALEHFSRYADLILAKNGAESIEYATALRHVANLKAFNGDLEGGSEDYMNSINISRGNLRERLRFLPSGMRESLLSDLTESLSQMIPFGISSGHTCDTFSLKAYEGLLLTKGILLSSDRSTAGLLQRYGSAEDKEDYATIQHLRNRLQLMSVDPAMADSSQALYHRLLTIDHRLATNCTRYGDIGDFANTTYSDIANSLGPDETLADFTSYTRDDGDKQYAAFIIRRDLEYPLLIPMCRQSQLDSLINANGGFISRLYEFDAAETLRRLCLDPVRRYATEGHRLYLVPSGALHSISFESIPLEDNVVAGERYNIWRLTSARKRFEFRPLSVGNRTAMLYGGITYNMDDDELALASLPLDNDMAAAFIPRSPSVHTDTLPYLPYTLAEVNSIASLLADSVSTVIPLTGKRATEASFLSLSGHSPLILHIATHGFYFEPDDKTKAQGLAGVTDPMNLSGLVMSGGNAEWTGQPLPATTLGGLLTASDIARCDLSATTLVCLSGCHTARGSAATSEGLYGLQRAFKKAGAGTLVMSLWEASDLSTTVFMNSFYKNLVSNGFRRHKAFEAARSEVRSRFPEPYYWAGFIMVD